MHLDAAHLLLVAGAALLAGAVNAVAGGGTLLSFPAQAAPPRVFSLDQCADQYVLALSPRALPAPTAPPPL